MALAVALAGEHSDGRAFPHSGMRHIFDVGDIILTVAVTLWADVIRGSRMTVYGP